MIRGDKGDKEAKGDKEKSVYRHHRGRRQNSIGKRKAQRPVGDKA